MTQQNQALAQPSKFAKVSGARPQRSGNYIRNGHYLQRIDRVEGGAAFKKGDFIAVQQTTVHVFPDSTPGFDYNLKQPTPLMKVGESASDIMMMANVAFEGRVKAFLMAAGNLVEADFAGPSGAGAKEQYAGQLIERMISDEQPVAGVLVEVRAETVIKQNARNKSAEQLTNADVYTRYSYVRAVPFAEVKKIVPEDVAARLLPDLDKAIAEETGEAGG